MGDFTTVVPLVGLLLQLWRQGSLSILLILNGGLLELRGSLINSILAIGGVLLEFGNFLLGGINVLSTG